MCTERQAGTTLIELVMAIAVAGVLLVGLMTAYSSIVGRSADPMVRIRSVELAQSTLEEILSKAFDQNTPVGGGCVHFAANSRCPVGACRFHRMAPTCVHKLILCCNILFS